VGCELSGSTDAVPFEISQRADFFEEEVGLETTLKRPIVNTRDEPHADPAFYRRLHVIIGDANMSETATLLKVGTTAIVLAMIEDDWLTRDLTLAAPVDAVRHVSHDLTLRRPLALRDGSTITALEIQWEFHERAVAWVAEHGPDLVGGHEVCTQVLDGWHRMLVGLSNDPESLADEVDWIAKRRLITAYADRHDLGPSDPRLRAVDLQYHDLRPDRSLAARAGLRTICSEDEISDAISTPPDDTRAYFRGRCLSRFGDEIVSANWDSMVFDTGGSSLRRVSMMEPSRGTAAHVASVIDASRSASELLDRLGA